MADDSLATSRLQPIRTDKGRTGDMNREFPEIQADDFSKISLQRLPHQEIEMALIQIGGGGVRGTQFKTDAVRAAGWNGERLSTYAGKPDVAAQVFNRLRDILAETDDMAQVMARLQAG
jgi:hypothetical protein